jgi:hypothetical protein
MYSSFSGSVDILLPVLVVTGKRETDQRWKVKRKERKDGGAQVQLPSTCIPSRPPTRPFLRGRRNSPLCQHPHRCEQRQGHEADMQARFAERPRSRHGVDGASSEEPSFARLPPCRGRGHTSAPPGDGTVHGGRLLLLSATTRPSR